MYSAHVVYGVGLLVSVVNVILWTTVVTAQIRQYGHNKMNDTIKTLLLVFGVVSLLSNLTPIWFDIYRMFNPGHPSNVGYAYITSQYLYRTLTAIVIYLVYRY